MTECLQLLLEQWNRIASYFAILMHIVVAPKTTIERLSPRDKPNVSGSLAFLTASYATQMLMLIPISEPQQRSVVTLSCLIFLSVCGTMPFALMIHLAWKIVGGSATFLSSFVISAYLSGVAVIIISFGGVVGATILMVLDLPLYNSMVHHLAAGDSIKYSHLDVLGLATLYAVNLVNLLSVVIAFVWFVAGWGAYRTVHRALRWQSLVAFIVALVLEIPVLVIILVVAAGIGMHLLDGG